MSAQPVVGVVAHHHVVPRPFGAMPVTGAPSRYLEALIAAGARAVLLPGGTATDLLDRVDALVLTGGGDLDPRHSGADPASCSDVDRSRDDDEIALVRAARAAGVPVLGVCRGLQVLAVAFGGTLSAVTDHTRPHTGHPVTTSRGSLLYELLGRRLHTSALHHQAVADPGTPWRATARADDGTIEGIEWTDPGWTALGVQWHPELTGSADIHETTGPAVFGWLRAAS